MTGLIVFSMLFLKEESLSYVVIYICIYLQNKIFKHIKRLYARLHTYLNEHSIDFCSFNVKLIKNRAIISNLIFIIIIFIG